MLAELSPVDRLANALTHDLRTTWGEPNGWTKKDQEVNFKRFAGLEGLSGVSFVGSSCVDLGCGTGDFLSYWRSMNGGEYTGIDILPTSVETAKSIHYEGTFFQEDFLSFELPERYDFAFASGPFNLRLQSATNYEFIEAAIRKMAGIVDVGMAFNFLTDDLLPKDKLFYYDTETVIDMIKESAPDFSFVVHTDILPDHRSVGANALLWRK